MAEEQQEDQDQEVESQTQQEEDLSRDVLLTALAKCKFTLSPKESKKVYKQRCFTRITKINLYILNAFALVFLAFGILSYLKIGQDFPYYNYIWANLALAGIILGVDLFWFIRYSVLKGKLKRKIKSGENGTWAFYFLKTLAVVEEFQGVEEFEKNPEGRKVSVTPKTQHRFNYSDIQKMLETEDYFWIVLVDGEEFFFYKKAVVKRKIEMDELRQKLMEETGKNIYSGAKDSDMHYQNNEVWTRKCCLWGDVIKGWLLGVTLWWIFVLLTNFRSGVDMDYMWMGWLGLILCTAFIIPSIFLKLHYSDIDKKSFRKSMWGLSINAALFLVFDILGSLYGSLTAYSKRIVNLKAETGIDYFPTSAIVSSTTDYAYSTKTRQDDNDPSVFYTLYLDPMEADFNREEQVESLNQGIENDPEHWQTSLKSSQLGDYIPLNTPYFNYDGDKDYDYFLIYSPTLDSFFPTNIPGAENTAYYGRDIIIEFFFYDKDEGHVFLLTYNIVNGKHNDF